MSETNKDHLFPKCLFIAGTDTGVGKTVVSAMLTAGLKGFYWKPVQSGLNEMTDTSWVMEKTGLAKENFIPETYRLTLPLSPHAAALMDGVRIDPDSFHMPEISQSANLIIEGAGGVMVPLNEEYLMTDLMKKLAAPILLVTRSSLGTINHTLLTLEKLRRERLEVLGVIINGPRNRSNRDAIEHYGCVRVLAEIDPIPDINSQSLIDLFDFYFNT
jgi:dethiobiotin synthetase